MPYKSMKQERWAHTSTGMKKMGKKTVDEFDQASKGLKLPADKESPTEDKGESEAIEAPKTRYTHMMKQI